MQFIHISKPNGADSHQAQSELLQAACQTRGLEYRRLVEGELSPVELTDLIVNSEDVVYRSARGQWAKTTEKLLIMQGCRSVYYDPTLVITGKGSSHDHMQRAGLPVIPSVPYLPRKKRQTLELAARLGGFPVVIKVSGGMEGIGVMRVDSPESFNSVSDFVRKDDNAHVRVMKYVAHKQYARLVVVGERVVAATVDEAPLGDFRGNARGPREVKGHPFEVDEPSSELAIAASRAVGVKLGGVDLLFADSGEIFLAEVNCPFNFAETQQVTGTDIAGAIVDQLLA